MGELAALAAAFLWACASILFARAGERTAPVPLNLVKTAFGLLMTAATLLVLGLPIVPDTLSPSDWGWLGLSGVLGLTLGDSAFLLAINRLGPRRAMLMWALVPPLTALIAWPVLDEVPGAGALAGGGLTLAGVAWVLRERSAEGPDLGRSEGVALGLTMGLVAVACQAVGSVTAKMAGSSLDAATLSVVRLGFGTAGLVLQVTLQRGLPQVVALLRRRGDLGVVVLATFLGTYLGLWLSMASLQLTLAGIAATLTATSPIFVLPLARIFLKERLSMRAVFGALVAVAGVAVLALVGSGA